MITENQLLQIVEDHLKGTSLFPVDLAIRSGNRIYVDIDGDQAVTVDDCKALNRYIETMIDREQEDFELTVSTSGADRPLKFPRQYPKHVGRDFEIKLGTGETLTGKLVSSDATHVILTPAPAKKEPAKENIQIPFSEIQEAKIKLSFK